MPVWEADDVLSLDEVATALRLDRRTVRRVAFQLGGKRFAPQAGTPRGIL